MKLSRKIKIPIIAVLVACELALYITFMAGNLDVDTDTAVKYSGVCICALYALYCCHTLRAEDFLLLGAMIFTIVSDWFLLVTGKNIEIGLCTFIVAQLLHFVRISLKRKKVPIVSIIMRVVIPIVAIVVMAFIDGMLSTVTILIAVYFPQLVMNFIDSFALIKKNKLYMLLSIGMFLFICCDVFVGLYNLSDATSIEISSSLQEFSGKAMWAFYLPSQTCIVLTGATYNGMQSKRM